MINFLFLMITAFASTSFRLLVTRSLIFPRPIQSFSHMMGTTKSSEYPIYADESLMKAKAHGTCEKPVMKTLRWGCDHETADRICCFNRHYAEHSGYWESTKFITEVNICYCSFTSLPL
jgi:hypothetical protein